MFVILAIALRRKPDVLINLLPIIRVNPKYQGQDKLPVTVWVIAQVTGEFNFPRYTNLSPWSMNFKYMNIDIDVELVLNTAE